MEKLGVCEQENYVRHNQADVHSKLHGIIVAAKKRDKYRENLRAENCSERQPKGEKLVVKNAIYDRNVMDKNEEEFSGFCDQLKQMTEVYDNTIKKYKEKYESMIKKKQENVLSIEDEEELMDVFRILKSYGEVDEIPAEMLNPGSSFPVVRLDLVNSTTVA